MFRRRPAKLQQLASVPMLEGCGKETLRTVADLGELVTFEPGSVLVEEGSLSSQVFIIVDGSVEVSSDEEILATLDDGSVLGEAALLDWWVPPRDQQERYTTGRRTATVSASPDAPVRTLVFEPRGFEELRKKAPMVAQRLLSAMSERFRGGEPDAGGAED